MGLHVVSLRLAGFRSYTDTVFEPGAELTILVGPNAAGKTNAVEALQLVTAAASFRCPRWGDLVRWGHDRARVALRAGDGPDLLETSLDISADGGHSFSVNGKNARRRADVVGRFPSVVFSPEDLQIVKGPAQRRRAAADELGEQLSATYGAVRRDYTRVVRQRNRVLQEPGTSDSERAAWDEQLVHLGGRLLSARVRLVRRLSARAAGVYADLTGGGRLDISYEDRAGLGEAPTAEDAADALRECIVVRAAEERARGVTLVGPHRDDIRFDVEEKDARHFASQGQQRTIALALKLAEVRVVEEIAGRTPVLLLDDVMSELDEGRRLALTHLVQRDVQTIITTTNLGYFDPGLLERATVIRLGGEGR